VRWANNETAAIEIIPTTQKKWRYIANRLKPQLQLNLHKIVGIKLNLHKIVGIKL